VHLVLALIKITILPEQSPEESVGKLEILNNNSKNIHSQVNSRLPTIIAGFYTYKDISFELFAAFSQHFNLATATT